MKKHIYYCPNCGKEEIRPMGKQWCDCYEPPFEMAPHSKKRDEELRKQAAAFIGALGGKRTMKKYGSKHFSDAGKKGMAKRWAKLTPPSKE